MIVCGNAGVGKDTVGNYLVHNHGAVCIAQADPMKRICKATFDFTDQQLWGISQYRNEIDPRYSKGKRPKTGMDSDESLEEILLRVLPQLEGNDSAFYSFKNWYYDCVRQSEDEGLTPRFCLQKLGTEWGRTVKQDLWNGLAIDTAFRLLSNPNLCYKPNEGVRERLPQERSWESGLIVITDGRFRNELLGVMRVGGFAVKIERTQTGPSMSHMSETELKDIPLIFFDAIILNNDSLDFLRVKVDQMVSKLFRCATKF
jgi:hypothetical protein